MLTDNKINDMDVYSKCIKKKLQTNKTFKHTEKKEFL